MIWNPDVSDHMQLALYGNEQVTVLGVIDRSMSGVQFEPDPQPNAVILAY
jgi:hypothetical protein